VSIVQLSPTVPAYISLASYLFDLENQVESLKRQLAAAKASSKFSDGDSPTVASEPSSTHLNGDDNDRIKSAIADAALAPDSDSDEQSRGISLASLVLAGMVKSRTPIMSSLRMQGLSIIDEASGFSDTPKRASNPVLIPPLPTRDVIDHLISAYLVYFNASSPILHEEDLKEQVRRVCDSPTEATECDVFIVLSAFVPHTVSTQSSRSIVLTYIAQWCLPLVHSFFRGPRTRIQSSDGLLTSFTPLHNPTSTRSSSHITQSVCKGCFSLPTILSSTQSAAVSSLDAHYRTVLTPRSKGAWYLTGLALRMCVDFGLHQEEPPSKVESNPRRLDMKRRLFWCSYTLDRSLSGMLGRPPSFPDEWITCPVCRFSFEQAVYKR
jgi:hypothetical protein